MSDESVSARMLSVAALLEQHSKIHLLSVATTAAAIVMLLASALLSPSPSFLWLLAATSVIATGLAETWFAVRVGFDRRLLQSIAADPEQLQRWDQALLALKLLPESKAGRDPDERLRGCIRLLKRQAELLIVQLAIAIIGVVTLQLYR